MAKSALPIIIGAGALLLFMGGGKKSKGGGDKFSLPSWADGVDLGPLPDNLKLVDKGAAPAEVEGWASANYPLVMFIGVGFNRSVVGNYLIEIANANPGIGFVGVDPSWATDVFHAEPGGGYVAGSNLIAMTAMKDANDMMGGRVVGIQPAEQGEDPLAHIQLYADAEMDKAIIHLNTRSSQARAYSGNSGPLGQIKAMLTGRR